MPFALVALVAAACSVEESPMGPDGGVSPGEDGGSSDTDAPVGSAGLVIEFRGIPALPADLDGEWNAQLDQIRIDLENLRAVGDAAPGDERTTRDELRLEWSGGGSGDDGGDDPSNEAVVVTFDQAPPGLYSNIFAQLTAYKLEGEVELDENERDFEIDDSPPAGIALSIPLGGVTLEAGETRRVIVEVSCVEAVNGTPWDQVEEEEGELVVDAGSLEIEAIRDAVRAGFVYQGDDEIGAPN